MVNTTSQFACLAAAVFCCLGSVVQAQHPFPDWIEDSSGCKVMNPQSQPVESIRWTGRCKLGYADGPGVVHWFSAGKPNGMTSGTFKEGKLTGRGSVIFPHAIHTRTQPSKGDFQLFHSWPFGSRLDGVFSENRLIGDGIVTEPNGQKTVVIQIDGKLFRK